MMVESCPISDYPFHGGKEAPTQQVKGTLNRMILGGATDFNNYLQLQHEDAAGRTAVNEYVARVVGMLVGRRSRIAHRGVLSDRDAVDEIPPAPRPDR